MTIARTALDTIGDTPIVQLQRLPGNNAARALVKLESFNPTGSCKDRMARAIIEGAEARGDLKPGMTVVELTGGSTGSSLALVCAVKGYPLKIVTSDAFAEEKLKTMHAFGAELIIEPSEANMLNPTCSATAQSSIAPPNAPPWDMKAMFPDGGPVLMNVAFRPAFGLTKPRQFGPRMRMPYFFLAAITLCSSNLPSSPISLKPAEIMTAPSIPARPHSSTISGTALAGVAITARLM